MNAQKGGMICHGHWKDVSGRMNNIDNSLKPQVEKRYIKEFSFFLIIDSIPTKLGINIIICIVVVNYVFWILLTFFIDKIKIAIIQYKNYKAMKIILPSILNIQIY